MATKAAGVNDEVSSEGVSNSDERVVLTDSAKVSDLVERRMPIATTIDNKSKYKWWTPIVPSTTSSQEREELIEALMQHSVERNPTSTDFQKEFVSSLLRDLLKPSYNGSFTVNMQRRLQNLCCRKDRCRNFPRSNYLCSNHGGRGLCKFKGCVTFANVRGLCTAHYVRPTCIHPGCTEKSVGHNTCRLHRKNQKLCLVVGCDSPVRSNNYCSQHIIKPKCSVKGCTLLSYSSNKCLYHGSAKLRVCIVEECDKFAKKNLLCRRHGPLVSYPKIMDYISKCKKRGKSRVSNPHISKHFIQSIEGELKQRS